MRINQAGIDLIKRFEGLRLDAYADPIGILTIGYGHTGNDVSPHKKISKDEANELLRTDISKFESGIKSLVIADLTDNQFSALVVLAFNIGLGNLKKSTLLRKINEGDFDGAAMEFGKWMKAGGKILPGLIARREAESELFRQT